MIDTNIEFLEEYKELDILIRDYLNSDSGVTAYIMALESMPSDKQFLYVEDLKMLKHLRWLRNKLAHETDSMNLDLCTKEDIDDVRKYYEKIINIRDPLHILSNKNIGDTKEIYKTLKKQEKKKVKKNNYNTITIILMLLIVVVFLTIIYMLFKI